MNSADYIKLRVEDQINWMEGKSKWNQSRYKVLKVIEIVAAAMIPLLVSYQGTMETLKTFLGVTTGLLGVLIVILSSIRQLYKYQENWLTYRTTLESLKRERFLFETGASPYDDALAFQKFVANIESLLAKENESWKAVWSQVDQGGRNLTDAATDTNGAAVEPVVQTDANTPAEEQSSEVVGAPSTEPGTNQQVGGESASEATGKPGA